MGDPASIDLGPAPSISTPVSELDCQAAQKFPHFTFDISKHRAKISPRSASRMESRSIERTSRLSESSNHLFDGLLYLGIAIRHRRKRRKLPLNKISGGTWSRGGA